MRPPESLTKLCPACWPQVHCDFGLKYAISDKDGHMNSKKSLKIPKKSPGAPKHLFVQHIALDTILRGLPSRTNGPNHDDRTQNAGDSP